MFEIPALTHVRMKDIAGSNDKDFDEDGLIYNELLGVNGVIGTYAIGHTISSGQVGTVVYAARCVGGSFDPEQRLVLKAVDRARVRSVNALRRLNTEILVHSIIGAHAHISLVSDAFFATGRLFLVSEHGGGVDLFHWLSRTCASDDTPPDYGRAAADLGVPGRQTSLSDTRAIVGQTACALAHCLAHGVVHRDVKPENIIIAEESASSLPLGGDRSPRLRSDRSPRLRATLVDFGCAMLLREPPPARRPTPSAPDGAGAAAPPSGRLALPLPRPQPTPQVLSSEKCGSLGFVAPEVLESKNGAQHDVTKMDPWSLGAIMLEMVLGTDWFSSVWLATYGAASNGANPLHCRGDDGRGANIYHRRRGGGSLRQNVAANVALALRVTRAMAARVPPTAPRPRPSSMDDLPRIQGRRASDAKPVVADLEVAFWARSVRALPNSIVAAESALGDDAQELEHVADLLEALLDLDARRRPNAAQAAAHPWLGDGSKIGWLSGGSKTDDHTARSTASFADNSAAAATAKPVPGGREFDAVHNAEATRVATNPPEWGKRPRPPKAVPRPPAAADAPSQSTCGASVSMSSDEKSSSSSSHVAVMVSMHIQG